VWLGEHSANCARLSPCSQGETALEHCESSRVFASRKRYNDGVTLPAYWLSRPEFSLEPHRDHFERVLHDALETGVARGLEVPVWAFLCWLCDERGYVAHGTGRDDIAVFEPRQSNDVGEFGNRKAVYASSDGVWAMFFAIMNRPEVPMTVVNAAVRADLNGRLEHLYFFGASRHAVQERAYRDGWVYLLPDAGFERQPGGEAFGVRYETHHCANLETVRPAFRVAVRPEDFPFLEQIHPYDDAELGARAQRDPNGFPWLEGEASRS
jgi:hypothetical protein